MGVLSLNIRKGFHEMAVYHETNRAGAVIVEEPDGVVHVVRPEGGLTLTSEHAKWLAGALRRAVAAATDARVERRRAQLASVPVAAD